MKAETYFDEKEFSKALDKISMDFFGHTNWEYVRGEKRRFYVFKFNVPYPMEDLE
tara:strand:+ start:272 stop:436 length:165 start_codon:yes stop_codon:yes gene_type:complete